LASTTTVDENRTAIADAAKYFLVNTLNLLCIFKSADPSGRSKISPR
jgi:hypothetical protein